MGVSAGESRVISKVLGAALAVAFGLSGACASASVIHYRLSGVIDGVLKPAGGGQTAFAGRQFVLLANGDTSTLTLDPGVAGFVDLIDAKVFAQGFGPETLPVHAGVEFAIGYGANTGLAALGDASGGPFVASILMSSPAFAGYDGVSDFAPVSLSGLQFDSGYPVSVDYTSGDELQVDAFDHPVFSASVPEPASWAVMLVGVAAVGGMMRRRRLQPA